MSTPVGDPVPGGGAGAGMVVYVEVADATWSDIASPPRGEASVAPSGVRAVSTVSPSTVAPT